MTLIEAVKSGNKFRRNGKPFWIILVADGRFEFSYEDILADDWITEEQKISLTKNQITEAIFDLSGEFSSKNDYVTAVLKYLGFK